VQITTDYLFHWNSQETEKFVPDIENLIWRKTVDLLKIFKGPKHQFGKGRFQIKRLQCLLFIILSNSLMLVLMY